MEQYLQAIVTVLSLVNPLICGAMFAQMEAGQSQTARLADATKVALAVSVILVIAALAGARVLQIFGVSLDAFSVAGGGVLTGSVSLCCAVTRPRFKTPRSIAPLEQSIGPVILFAASPGTITGVITLAVAHSKLALPFRHSSRS